MQYTLVFDAPRDGRAALWFPAPGLLAIAVGTGLLLYQRWIPNPARGKWRRRFPEFFTAFAAIWTALAFLTVFTGYANFRDALAAGHYRIVEGIVTNFTPAPFEGHKNEEFDVDGHHYSFSDYVVIPGYHKTRSHGGAIRDGLRVRIADVNGQIARLEIAADSTREHAP